MRGPHRDSRNIGNNMVVALTTHQSGGELWVAEPAGKITMIHQGLAIQGRAQDVSTPFVFPARSVLHATMPWNEPRRVILVSFTPIGTLTLQNNFNPHRNTQRRIHDYFGQKEPTV